MNLVSLWDNAQNLLKNKVGDTSYETWFTTINAIEKNPQTLTIETPDEFFKSWVVEHYQQLIQETINKLAGQNIFIEFIVNNSILESNTQSRLNEFEKRFKEENSPRSNLNSR